MLPELDPAIPFTWEFDPTHERSLAVANLMVDAGLLTDTHVAGRKSLRTIIESYFTQRTSAVRPTELPYLCVSVADDVKDLNVHWKGYSEKYKVHPADIFAGATPQATGEQPDKYGEDFEDRESEGEDCKLGALIIAFNPGDGMHVETIGPALESLDQWPRVGQTVLDILEDGLMKTTRCISPGTCIDWACQQYWQGEEDERMVVDDELKYARERAHERHKKEKTPGPLPSDEEIIEDEIVVMTRKKFDASIPPKWHRQRKALKELPFILDPAQAVGHGTPQTLMQSLNNPFTTQRCVELWPQIYEACQRIRELRRASASYDNECCENVSWESCPFMLRLRDDDCTVRIADDAWQDIANDGCVLMEINSVFLWHDARSFKSALQRLTNFVAIVHACENLIRLLTSKAPEPIKIQVRI